MQDGDDDVVEDDKKVGKKEEKREKRESGPLRKQTAAAAKKAKKRAADKLVSGQVGKPKFMTPADVEEILRRLWQNESGVLQHLYASETGRGSQGKGSGEGYKMFFLHAIAVAPNKFR